MSTLLRAWICGLGLMMAPALAMAEARFRLTADPATLDWNLARSSHETYVIMNIMEGLVEAADEVNPRPALAERWEVSSDGKTYRFFLRAGVKWSDGRALKASDFVDSWVRLLDPKTDSSYGAFLLDIEGAEAFHAGKTPDPKTLGLTAVGDLELKIKLKQSVPHFIHLLSFWVTFPIRTDLILKHGKAWTETSKLVTLGPYQISDWKKGKSIRFKRNPSYYGKDFAPLPKIDEVEAVIESDDRKARTFFQQGKLDFLLDVTTSDLMALQAGEQKNRFRIERFPYLATYYLGFNVAEGPLKDVQVRKALALSLDRAAVPSVLQGGQVVAQGWIPPGVDGHGAGNLLEGSLYDARAAIARAGYVEGTKFPKLTLWLETFDGAKTLGDHLAKALREKLGVEIQAKVATPQDYQAAIRARKAAIFVGHWGADFPDPVNFFEVFTSVSGSNPTSWKSREYDSLVERARAAHDKAERLRFYSQAEQALLKKDVVIVPLFHRQNTVLVSNRLKDFWISPLNYLFLKRLTLN